MDIYIGDEWVGIIAASSMYDLSGRSYVHLSEPYRRELGLKNYDEFFDTMKDAYEWLLSVLPDVNFGGLIYDWNDGRCKRILDFI